VGRLLFGSRCSKVFFDDFNRLLNDFRVQRRLAGALARRRTPPTSAAQQYIPVADRDGFKVKHLRACCPATWQPLNSGHQAPLPDECPPKSQSQPIRQTFSITYQFSSKPACHTLTRKRRHAAFPDLSQPNIKTLGRPARPPSTKHKTVLGRRYCFANEVNLNSEKYRDPIPPPPPPPPDTPETPAPAP